MAAKLKSKTYLLNIFFGSLSHFLRSWLWSFQKVLIWQNYFFLNEKRYQKNAEVHAYIKFIENVLKNAPK